MSSDTENKPLVTSSGPIKKNVKEGKEFKYNEDGRRYHGNKDIAYVLPNDDDEEDRLHEQHWVLKYILQHDYLAPVTKMLEEGITVLDSGCGPAIWTFEMTEQYPLSKFYGIDVSFVFPESIKSGNVELVLGNIAKKVPYPDNTFDYIHQRLLMAGLTSDNWDSTLKEMYRVLKPGGYIELAEFSGDYFDDTVPNWVRLQKAIMSLFRCINIPARISTELMDRLVKAGFVNEHLETILLPVNHDGKRGNLLWKDLENAYLSMRPTLSQIISEWQNPVVYKKFIADCGVEAKEKEHNVKWHVYYAQKPYN